MVFYYIVRDVVRGADCSYKPGRTLLNNGPVNRYREDAQRACDRYNQFCHVAGVCYLVIPHRDDKVFVCDYYESGEERCTVCGHYDMQRPADSRKNCYCPKGA